MIVGVATSKRIGHYKRLNIFGTLRDFFAVIAKTRFAVKVKQFFLSVLSLKYCAVALYFRLFKVA